MQRASGNAPSATEDAADCRLRDERPLLLATRATCWPRKTVKADDLHGAHLRVGAMGGVCDQSSNSTSVSPRPPDSHAQADHLLANGKITCGQDNRQDSRPLLAGPGTVVPESPLVPSGAFVVVHFGLGSGRGARRPLCACRRPDAPAKLSLWYGAQTHSHNRDLYAYVHDQRLCLQLLGTQRRRPGRIHTFPGPSLAEVAVVKPTSIPWPRGAPATPREPSRLRPMSPVL